MNTLRIAVAIGGMLASAVAAPVCDQVDVLVSGGTLSAVRTAVAARRSGKSVFLVAPRPYLGEDKAATLDLERSDADDPSDPLVQAIFSPSNRAAAAWEPSWILNTATAVKIYEQYADAGRCCETGGLESVTTPLIVKRTCDRALLDAGVRYLTSPLAIRHAPQSQPNVMSVSSRERMPLESASRPKASCSAP